LLALLEQSRAKNAKLDITGILVCYKKHFLQVLEGERETIFDLFKTIREDERHTSVITCWDNPISKREFKDWTMAFVNFNDMDKSQVKGYSSLLEKGFTTEITDDQLSVIKKILLECVALLSKK